MLFRSLCGAAEPAADRGGMKAGGFPLNRTDRIRFPWRKDFVIALVVRLEPVSDLAALGPRFRALERVARPSFFQSWSWTGCLTAERFADPLLLAAQEDGRDVALALFNRRSSRLAPDTLWLGESGIADLDAMYIEHNGILMQRDDLLPDRLMAVLLTDCLRVVRPSGWGRLVLSGVDDAHLAAARAMGGEVRVLRSQPAPFVRLDGGEFLAGLGANTRYQLRRSAKRYAARGALLLHRAASVSEALAVLDELAVLHQATWTARGKPGAFANPVFRRFHRALIERAMPRGEVDLLRITAGESVVGCLYNFRHDGRVLAYQSGFDHAGAGAHEKPGLTCHHLAIEAAAADGMTRYDFLAGEDRYKANLAHDATTLHWLDVTPRWSPRGVAARLRGMRRSG